MKIRQDDMAVLGKAAVLLARRHDLRIGQLIYNALSAAHYDIANGLWALEDDDLLNLIELFLAGNKKIQGRTH